MSKHYTEREAFTIFEGCLFNQPEAIGALARMDAPHFTEYLGWSAKFYDALSEGIDLFPGEEIPDPIDLSKEDGIAFLKKVVRAVKKNRFGEDTFW